MNQRVTCPANRLRGALARRRWSLASVPWCLASLLGGVWRCSRQGIRRIPLPILPSANSRTLFRSASRVAVSPVHSVGRRASRQLYLVLERGFSSEKATAGLRRVLGQRQEFVWLEPPLPLGDLTVLDVRNAIDYVQHPSPQKRLWGGVGVRVGGRLGEGVAASGA
jgi:hypothetical protein